MLNISVQNKETYFAEAKMIIDPIDEDSGSTYTIGNIKFLLLHGLARWKLI